jgi:molybdopterin synthase sulfur carrier subunit
MSIKINVSQAMTEYSTGERLGEVEGGTVGECIEALLKVRPNFRHWLFEDDGKLKEYVDIFINKESAFPDPLKKPVKDGDEIYLMSLIGGG